MPIGSMSLPENAYFFDVQSVSAGSTDWRLIDPYGQQVWYNSFDDVATQTLTVTGAYTLLIEGAIGNTSPIGYGFNVQKVTNTTAALTMGAQVDGAVTQTGQQNIYTFTLANASQLYFDSLTNDSNFTWTLTGPRGTEVNARSFQSSDAGNFGSSNPVLNLIAGSYTLAVAGTADGTGSYSFRLSDLSTAGMVTPGTPISGTLNPGAATNVYRINVSAGDLFYFDQQSQTSGSNLYWRLIDPFGSQVWSNSFSDVSTQALAFTGSYALLVEGGIGNTSQVSYTFNAQKVTNTTSALTLGTQVNGAIAQAGQQNLYTFTLANAGLLYFDSLTNDGSLNWTLTGPRGSEVTARSFTSSDANAFTTSPILSLIAGSYTQLRGAETTSVGTVSGCPMWQQPRCSRLARRSPVPWAIRQWRPRRRMFRPRRPLPTPAAAMGRRSSLPATTT